MIKFQKLFSLFSSNQKKVELNFNQSAHLAIVGVKFESCPQVKKGKWHEKYNLCHHRKTEAEGRLLTPFYLTL